MDRALDVDTARLVEFLGIRVARLLFTDIEFMAFGSRIDVVTVPVVIDEHDRIADLDIKDGGREFLALLHDFVFGRNGPRRHGGARNGNKDGSKNGEIFQAHLQLLCK